MWSLSRLLRSRPSRPLVALLQFRDARRLLDGWLANVTPQVDAFIALDDGSRDGAAERLALHPKCLELLRRERQEHDGFDEVGNHARLHAAAARLAGAWFVAVDADERLERSFRRRAEREIDRLERLGARAASVRIVELWDRPDRMRVDGRWADKRHARLFAHRVDPELDPRPLHGHWAPLDSRLDGGFPEADLIVYHLGMLRRADRQARRRRWEERDPYHLHQPIGYAHLTDETGLELAPLPRGRAYRPRESFS